MPLVFIILHFTYCFMPTVAHSDYYLIAGLRLVKYTVTIFHFAALVGWPTTPWSQVT
jgi:hypothetical protein